MLTEAELRWLMTNDRRALPTLDELLRRERPAWMDRAACRGHPTELFFPSRGQSTAPAQAICAGCPVRSECADYALERHHLGVPTEGIWGGTSGRQRRRVRGGDVELRQALEAAQEAPGVVSAACGCCGRPPGRGDGEDRLKAGYGPCCYKAWTRWRAAELARGREPSRARFEAWHGGRHQRAGAA